MRGEKSGVQIVNVMEDIWGYAEKLTVWKRR